MNIFEVQYVILLRYPTDDFVRGVHRTYEAAVDAARELPWAVPPNHLTLMQLGDPGEPCSIAVQGFHGSTLLFSDIIRTYERA